MPNSEKSVVPNQVKETLYDQLFKAITDPYAGTNKEVALACQTISEEWAKGFAEWADRNYERTPNWSRWKKRFEDSKLFTTDKLIQLYKIQTKK